MNWTASQHPIETLAEWGAPALLAAAAGWAGLAVASATVAAIAAAMAFVTGLKVMRMAGRGARVVEPRFEPIDYTADAADAADADELLLEAKDELLELDDPLIEPQADSRVVQLFARPEPTPGELVERIEGYLVGTRGGAPATCRTAEAQAPVDASAALHAALANIRASLR